MCLAEVLSMQGFGSYAALLPELRLLSARIEGAGQSRAVAFYTASFSVGASLSVLVTGMIAERYGWRSAFGISAVGGMIAAAIAMSIPRRSVEARHHSGLLDL